MNKLLFVCAVSLAAAGPALANGTQRSRAVSYADLDLTRAEGRAAFDQRIARAIGFVCDPPTGIVSMLERQEARRCVRQTAAAARPQIELALLRTRRSGEVQLASR